MNSILQEDILVTAFYDTEKMINKAVWKFYHKYGGELEDWKAEAHLIFMQAHDSYNDNLKVKFSTHLHTLLYSLLKNYQKSYIAKPQLLKFDHEETIGGIENIPDPKQQLYRLVDLLDDMKADAKILIDLICDMPEELKQEKLNIYGKNKYYKSNHAIHMKVFLKKYLRKLGWTHSRIQKTFTEIGDKINA